MQRLGSGCLLAQCGHMVQMGKLSDLPLVPQHSSKQLALQEPQELQRMRLPHWPQRPQLQSKRLPTIGHWEQGSIQPEPRSPAWRPRSGLPRKRWQQQLQSEKLSAQSWRRRRKQLQRWRRRSPISP